MADSTACIPFCNETMFLRIHVKNGEKNRKIKQSMLKSPLRRVFRFWMKRSCQSPSTDFLVPALAASACSLVLFGIIIAGNLYNINNNPNGTDGKYRPYAAISSIDAYLEAGDDAFSRNDYITASLYYDYARTLTAAWQGYLTDGEGLKEALAANTGDTHRSLFLARLRPMNRGTAQAAHERGGGIGLSAGGSAFS